MQCFCFESGCPDCDAGRVSSQPSCHCLLRSCRVCQRAECITLSASSSSRPAEVAAAGCKESTPKLRCNCLLEDCADCQGTSLAPPVKRRRRVQGGNARPEQQSEMSVLRSSEQCMCSLDPFVRCPTHKCHCASCAQGGNVRRQASCAWQLHNQAFIQKHGLNPSRCTTLYCNLHGLPYQTASVRNRLNVLSCFAEQKLEVNSKLLVFDLSQSLYRSGARWDGSVPTLTTKSQMFSMALRNELPLDALANLMGFAWRSGVWELMSASQWRIRLGNTMHVAVIGAVIMSALAAVRLGPKSARAPPDNPFMKRMERYFVDEVPAPVRRVVQVMVRDFLRHACYLCLTVATDCSGIEAPMAALYYFAKEACNHGLVVEVDHVSACEKDRHGQLYISTVVGPRQTFRDVLSRQCVEGQYLCEDLEGRMVPLPRNVDLYVSGFSCEPFSMQHTKSHCFEKKKAKFSFAVKDYIEHVRPRIVILENVTGLDRLDSQTGETCLNRILKLLGAVAGFTWVHERLTPQQFGFPISRPRYFFVGLRDDVSTAGWRGRFRQYLERLQSPLTATFWDYVRESK